MQIGKLWFYHLGHFFLDFLPNLDKRDLKTYPRPILVIFEICHFWQFQGHLITFQKMDALRRSKFFWWRGDYYPLVGLALGGQVPRLHYGPIWLAFSYSLYCCTFLHPLAPSCTLGPSGTPMSHLAKFSILLFWPNHCWLMRHCLVDTMSDTPADSRTQF